MYIGYSHDYPSAPERRHGEHDVVLVDKRTQRRKERKESSACTDPFALLWSQVAEWQQGIQLRILAKNDTQRKAMPYRRYVESPLIARGKGK